LFVPPDVVGFRGIEQDKYGTTCTVTGEGTISNSGFENAALDELTHAVASECVDSAPMCGSGGQQEPLIRGFPQGSRLAGGPPVKDEINFPKVAVYCGGALTKSSAGIVSPLIKPGTLVFDKGHGELAGNGAITTVGKWKIATTTGKKVAAK
jgi:hypothetical protein